MMSTATQTSTTAVTTVDLLRHGACEGGEIYRGTTDVALSDDGWQQMEQAVGTARSWTRVVVSPLQRARLFGQAVAERLAVPLDIVDGLREMDFGEWEGRLLQDVHRESPDLIAQFYRDPANVTPPGGEPVVDAQLRIVAAWQSILEQWPEDDLLLICHGGVIRLLLSHLLVMPLSSITRLHIPYAAMARVQVHHTGGQTFPVLQSLHSSQGPS